jgi:hypothetical protein
LIIKHADLGGIMEHIWPRMNTSKTSNVHQYVDRYKRFSLFFAYSNVNEALKEGENLFSQDKGLFFIVNDHTNHNVENYVKNHASDFEIVAEGIADGEIDVYKSKSVNTDVLVVKIFTPPPQVSVDDDNNDKKPVKKGVIKKGITKI